MKLDDPATLSPVAGPPVERMIVRDMLRRGWPGLLALVALGAFWGLAGVPSAAIGAGVAVANALLAAGLVSSAARIGLGMVYAAVLGGYLVRLTLVTAVVLAIVRVDWVEVVPLSFALVIAHLGLFVWEARFVSTSLAFPGLKPPPGGPRAQRGAP